MRPKAFLCEAESLVVFIRSTIDVWLADGVSNDIPGNLKCCLNIIKFTRERTSAVVITLFTHTLAFNRLPHLSSSSSNSIYYGQSFVCVCWMCAFELTFAKTFCNVNGAEYGANAVRRKLNHIEMIKTYCRIVDYAQHNSSPPLEADFLSCQYSSPNITRFQDICMWCQKLLTFIWLIFIEYRSEVWPSQARVPNECVWRRWFEHYIVNVNAFIFAGSDQIALHESNHNSFIRVRSHLLQWAQCSEREAPNTFSYYRTMFDVHSKVDNTNANGEMGVKRADSVQTYPRTETNKSKSTEFRLHGA